MTDPLTELERLARAAMQNRLPQSRSVEVSAERVLALVECVQAADAMRKIDFFNRAPGEIIATNRAYDAARAKLEQMK